MTPASVSTAGCTGSRSTKRSTWCADAGLPRLADETLDEQPGPEEAATHDQDDKLMQGALMQLKVEYRVVIVLKHLQGCAYDEIAGILECPVKTVKSRLFTARQALRDVLVAKGRL
jgi:RNA polymerase sigma factor, sigma-70 family